MTVIIGLEHDGLVWLAGDSCVCLGKDEWALMHQPKVRAVNGLCLGAAGDLRGGNLALTWKPPTYPNGGRVYPWLVREFVPRWIQDLHDNTLGDDIPNIDLLVGVAGELYHVDGDGAVYRKRHGYAALGTAGGAGPALGVLGGCGWNTPRRRLKAALDEAAEHCAWCRPPWTVVHT